jgi:two-component system, NtrC family, sensor kinase
MSKKLSKKSTTKRRASSSRESVAALKKTIAAQEKTIAAQAQQVRDGAEQQSATSEVLRMIAGATAPGNLQAVLDALAESAARLCDAKDAQVFRLENEIIHRMATYGDIPAALEHAPYSRESPIGRAMVDRQLVHIRDLAAVVDTEFPVIKTVQRHIGHRTTLAVPLVRDESPIGAILIRRMEVRPFTDNQISLLKTFADQAVIAIENVRLFKELQASNHDLTEALEQQTATSEVLKVISRSAFDLRPVLETLIENATRLCGANQGYIYKLDDDLFRLGSPITFPPN